MFQIVEINAAASTPQDLRTAILKSVEDGSVAVFRGGGKRLTLDEWSAFLSRDCGFLHDRRHYNFSASLELQDWWEISYQPEKSMSYAYSKTRQPLHNDNAWFSDPAEVNMFVMKKQAREGGVNMFYPVERLVADLAAEEPALFRDLTSVPVVIKKGEGEHFNRTTIIVADPELRVFWNYHRTEKPDPAITQLCESFRSFLERKEATKSVERVRSDSGDAFLFHDQKILHGRTAFTAEEPFERVLYQSMWRLK
jgi:alpha-ketoglutarate-dependent taurine dioxygenase